MISLWVRASFPTITLIIVEIIVEYKILLIWVLKLKEPSSWFISYIASSLKNRAFIVRDKLKLKINKDILIVLIL